MGYYFVTGRSVSQTGDPGSALHVLNCAGTLPSTCVGQGNMQNATGTSITGTSLGTIDPIGGFRPIPVPLVDNVNWSTGEISLVWNAASSVNDPLSITYGLLGTAKDAPSDPGSESEYVVPLGGFSGTSGVVNTSAFGFGPEEPKCYYFT